MTDELFALANSCMPTVCSHTGCVVNGVKFVVHSRDACRKLRIVGCMCRHPRVNHFTVYCKMSFHCSISMDALSSCFSVNGLTRINEKND